MKLRIVALIAGLFALAAANLHAGNLKVTLQPSAAVSAGAQWRVDGGSWKNSGATVKNLSNTTHQVTFKTISGWLTPAAQNVTVIAGNTTSITATYVRPAAVTVSLTPSSGQWRIDGGAWRASGTSATGLTPGNHQLEYSALAGYQTPATENISLPAGQTTTVARTYTALASFSVTLTPSNAQWRLDGGAWQASGATLTDLALGTATIDYSAVAGYLTPTSETVTLASGSNPPLTRTYAVAPGSVTVTLAPTSGQWRVDGGAWNASDATVANLAAGAHTLEYSPLVNHDSPLTETITLAGGEALSLTRGYTQYAQILIDLVPSSGQWRANGGAWNSSGTSLFVPPGSYTVEYSAVAGYTAPANDNLALTAAGLFATTRSYEQDAGSVRITLTPSTAQWRLDGGSWQTSGATLNNIPVGSHAIDYADADGYAPLASESITLAKNESLELTRAYTALSSLTIVLDPATAQWRLDGGAWNASGATLNHLSSGEHTIEYSAVADYASPAAETVTLAPGPLSLSRNYTPDPAFAIIHTFDDAGNQPTAIRGSDGWIYVATCSGETNGLGLLYKMQPDGSQRQVLLRFATDTVPGSQPKALIEGSDGVLYGTTLSGAGSTSTVSNGTIYRVNRDGSGYATLYVATAANWGRPNTLIEGLDGALYGTATPSGSGNNGKLFRLGKDGSNFTVLRSLFSNEGVNPQGIHQIPSGQIYLTNKTGGANNLGSIFRYDPATSSAAVIKSFAGGADGSDPRTRLTLGNDGMLYGTTAGGGGAGRGLVFRLNPDGSGYQVLRHFLGGPGDGALPESALLEQPDGMLYGTTSSGGANNRGTIFRVNKDGSNYAMTKSITGSIDEGSGPRHDLIPLGNGRLLGATTLLGAATRGVFFSLNLDGSGFTTVLQQGAPAGSDPWANVTEADGVLYGSTHLGGSTNTGTLYRVNRDGTGFTVLKSFTSADGVATPIAPLLAASDGFLYGSTYSPSKIFRLARDGSGFTAIQNLPNDTNGGLAWGGMIEASDGFIYGTTMSGGASGYGVLYRFAKPGTGYTVLRSFSNSTADGSSPTSTLVEGPDGRLYGTTSAGGTAGVGTVFAVNKDGTGFVILHHFTGGADGSGPYAGLSLSPDGTLFGTTDAGGAANLGTIYRIALDGSGYAVIKTFTGGANDGSRPTLSGVVERGGKLYGTTVAGGIFDAGTLYRIDSDGANFEVVINFGAGIDDATHPWAGLMKGIDGKLYGTGTRGPSGGTIYRLRVD